MTCSVNTKGSRTLLDLCPATFLPALRGRAFWIGLGLAGLLLSPDPLQAAPSPIQSDFADDAVVATLPDTPPIPEQLPTTSTDLADRVQNLISQARSTGDPRYLGYAERLFQRWPESSLNDRLLVLRATLSQSLHRFEQAREDLTVVLERSRNRQHRIQARLTLANLETVRGRYAEAQHHCYQLALDYPGLIAESCSAQVAARTGDPEAAYRALETRLANSDAKRPTARLWAEGTLGDIAAQLGREAAARHWRDVLSASPSDLYIRAQLADWHLQRGHYREVVALTESYEQVDSLAVIRAIAMHRSQHPEQDALTQQLRERFSEARWRGALLHQRDYARFLLDVEGRPEQALEHAWDNWQSQREPLDTRLLLRAAQAAGNRDTLAFLRQWLEQYGQTDARYPEVAS
ncbi:hypothetical protein DET50_104144 [Marinobacter pelagius]|uniref:Tetratricopeptide repeat protein n=1 Tax=Marinobacter pelagius TaxID=379482 RepID=A0A366GVW7_9GAMM|nr:hypothetical protein DET50_104144 [Marinobacter pelagius]